MPREPEPICVTLCTAPEPEADRLVDTLLDERLIACANLVGPVRSRYRWRGQVEEASEVLLVLKLRQDFVARVTTRIAELHSYDCPEVLSFTADTGLPEYMAWVAGEADGRSGCG